jgi:hypothetical protein
MKSFLIAGLALAMVACTTASPKQFYRPAGAEQQVEISGRFNQLSFEHQVLINGATVITGKLPYNYDDASFNGQFNEQSVISDCHWRSKTDLECLVKINDEMAATLTF